MERFERLKRTIGDTALIFRAVAFFIASCIAIGICGFIPDGAACIGVPNNDEIRKNIAVVNEMNILFIVRLLANS